MGAATHEDRRAKTSGSGSKLQLVSLRGDVTAILQPKILKEIDFAWVQQVVLSFIAKTERVVCRVW